jgi:uncharacterized protein (TIGR03435 family)
MQELDDITLLRQFAADRSEAAFEQLVSRHAGFVHSAALRQVRDPQMSAEITQAVFMILAQKAARISDKTILTGWLFKTTRFVALAQVRAEARRRQHEQENQMHSQIQSESPAGSLDEAWAQLSPLLDEALAQLGETDRQAVLLRFFENKSLAEVGNKLGTGEDTARKRISRALEKLRRFFAKHRVFYTTAIIAGSISANSIQAAPTGVAATIPAMALKGSAISVSTLTLVKEALKLMTIAKLKTAALIAAAALFATGTTLIVTKGIAQSGGDAAVLDDSVWDNLNSRALQALPPAFILRPTHFAPPGATGAAFSGGQGFGGGMVVAGNKMLGRAISFDALMAAAFGVDFNRVVSAPGTPAGAFDLLMTTSDASKEKLQAEIKRQLGCVAHLESRPTDVLLLTVLQANAPGLQPSQQRPGTARSFSRSSLSNAGGAAMQSKNFSVQNQTIADFVKNLQPDFNQPILDRTGLTGNFDVSLDVTYGNGASEKDAIMQTMPVQLGLQLTPGREPLDLLIVEKAK